MLQIVKDLLTDFNVHGLWAIVAAEGIVLSAIILASILSYFVVRQYLVSWTRMVVYRLNPQWAEIIIGYRVIYHLCYFAPAIIAYMMIPMIEEPDYKFTLTISHGLQILLKCYIFVNIGLVITKILNASEAVYNTYEMSKKRPIKSYLQVKLLR